MIRFFDTLFSFLGIALLSPLFLIIWLVIVIASRGGGFYGQMRVGMGGKEFRLWKFRTMHTGADRERSLTIGNDDHRITRIGKPLRKTKLDELPQLWNVLKGDMSIVGPRPELPKYVALYTSDQRKVLSVPPGITDYASIVYVDEDRLLGESTDPDKTYVEDIMPAKIALNMRYIDHRTAGEYFRIIFLTAKAIIF